MLNLLLRILEEYNKQSWLDIGLTVGVGLIAGSLFMVITDKVKCQKFAEKLYKNVMLNTSEDYNKELVRKVVKNFMKEKHEKLYDKMWDMTFNNDAGLNNIIKNFEDIIAKKSTNLTPGQIANLNEVIEILTEALKALTS